LRTETPPTLEVRESIAPRLSKGAACPINISVYATTTRFVKYATCVCPWSRRPACVPVWRISAIKIFDAPNAERFWLLRHLDQVISVERITNGFKSVLSEFGSSFYCATSGSNVDQK
jgi:hypothetical protein